MNHKSDRVGPSVAPRRLSVHGGTESWGIGKVIGSGHLWAHTASLYTAASPLERVPGCLQPGQGPFSASILSTEESLLGATHLNSPSSPRPASCSSSPRPRRRYPPRPGLSAARAAP